MRGRAEKNLRVDRAPSVKGPRVARWSWLWLRFVVMLSCRYAGLALGCPAVSAFMAAVPSLALRAVAGSAVASSLSSWSLTVVGAVHHRVSCRGRRCRGASPR